MLFRSVGLLRTSPVSPELVLDFLECKAVVDISSFSFFYFFIDLYNHKKATKLQVEKHYDNRTTAFSAEGTLSGLCSLRSRKIKHECAAIVHERRVTYIACSLSCFLTCRKLLFSFTCMYLFKILIFCSSL